MISLRYAHPNLKLIEQTKDARVWIRKLRSDEQRRRCLSYFGFMDLKLWLRSGFYGAYEK